MADTVNTNVLFDGSRKRIIQLTNESDGTGESAVVKVDVSAITIGPLGGNQRGSNIAPVKLAVEEIEWQVSGFNYVVLEFDATANDEIAVLKGSGYKNYRPSGGIVDPQSTGFTGDIVLTTDGAIDGASYDITLVLRKEG